MFTPVSTKFSNFIKKLVKDKIGEVRKDRPKDSWWMRYNDDEQCFQAAVMILEDEHRTRTGKFLEEEDVLASEIFLASDDNFLKQLAEQALEKAAECDDYIRQKIEWEVSTSSH
jgi:hypothetical protein